MALDVGYVSKKGEGIIKVMSRRGYYLGEQDLHDFTLQTNFEYDRMNSSLDLFLKTAIDGQFFICRGKAFHILGAICCMDLISEWLTKMSLFTPLVKCEWVAV